MHRIIVIAGPAGAGKDTLAAWICADYDAIRVGFVDPLTRFVTTLFGPGKHRAQMQEIGAVCRTYDRAVFIEAARRRVDSDDGPWVIADARFPEELAAFPEALTIGLYASQIVRRARLMDRDGDEAQDLHHDAEQHALSAIQQCALYYLNNETLDAFRAWYESTVRPAVEEG